MKSISYKFYIAALATIVMLLSGCRAEIEPLHIEGDKTSRAYLLLDGVYENKTVNYSIISSPYGSSLESIYTKFPVRITQPLSEEIKITLTTDASLVDAYNETNRTDFNAFNTGDFELAPATLTIPAGAMVSRDSVEIRYTGEAGALEEGAYVLPIRIASTDKPAAEISINRADIYLVANPTVYNNNVLPGYTAIPSGNMVTDRSGWVATADPATTGGSIDGGTAEELMALIFTEPLTEWPQWSRDNVLYTTGVSIVIDMGKVYTGITGLRARTSTWQNNMNRFQVFTAEKEGEWFDQTVGDRSLTLNTSHLNEYISFYVPVTARYIKLFVKGTQAGNYRLSGFWIYQK